MLVTRIEVVPNLPKCRVPVSSPYRTNTRTPGIVVEGIPVPGVCLVGVPSAPKSRVPVSSSYRTYRSVGYGYQLHTELTDVSSAGIEAVEDLTQESGTGIGFIPKLPKCRVPVSSSYRTLPKCRVPVLRWHRTYRGVGYQD